jgi:hypothetical protein
MGVLRDKADLLRNNPNQLNTILLLSDMATRIEKIEDILYKQEKPVECSNAIPVKKKKS